jgi:GNAT superfamily N-acetyltransferase
MIEGASSDQAHEILAVINISNREAYRGVIPTEHFREPVLFLEQLLGNLRRMAFYVCRSEGKIIGVAALDVENEEVGRIRWVYVLSEHQRKGIGTALVTHLERRAREMGLKRMRLLTVGGAKWAVSFYQKLGYELALGLGRVHGERAATPSSGPRGQSQERHEHRYPGEQSTGGRSVHWRGNDQDLSQRSRDQAVPGV